VTSFPWDLVVPSFSQYWNFKKAASFEAASFFYAPIPCLAQTSGICQKHLGEQFYVSANDARKGWLAGDLHPAGQIIIWLKDFGSCRVTVCWGCGSGG